MSFRISVFFHYFPSLSIQSYCQIMMKGRPARKHPRIPERRVKPEKTPERKRRNIPNQQFLGFHVNFRGCFYSSPIIMVQWNMSAFESWLPLDIYPIVHWTIILGGRVNTAQTHKWILSTELKKGRMTNPRFFRSVLPPTWKCQIGILGRI